MRRVARWVSSLLIDHHMVSVPFGILFSLCLYGADAYANEALWLKVGDVHALSAPPRAAVRVGAKGIVRVLDGDAKIRVIGLKPGVTTVTIGARVYRVRVSTTHQAEFARELRTILQSMMGLTLRDDEVFLTVDGALLRFQDWRRIASLAQRLRGEYAFQARPLPDVAEEARQHFVSLARTNGLPVVRMVSDPTIAILIPQGAKGLKTAVEGHFKSFGVQVRMAESDLHIQPLIRTRVVLAEVAKSSSRQFGLEWPTSYQANVLPNWAPEKDLMITLKALESSGQAQILATPTLLCRSGGTARFHAGGEIPIRASRTRTRIEVQWKSHGVLLKVEPKADYQGALSLKIETEVSLVDMANAVDGIPAIKKNSVQSHFDLPGKRTIALSGLMRQISGQSREGLAWLSSLPVLGALFSSETFLRNKSELIVFVTPEVYVPESSEPLALPEGWVHDER